MPILSHNQINDCLLHLRNKIQQLEQEPERKEEQTFELERLKKSLDCLRDNFRWILGIPEPKEESVIKLKKEKK